MNLSDKVTETPDVAILCRSHPVYLAHAAKIGELHPERRITFRTGVPWRSGEVALEVHGPRTLYLLPEGEEMVEYEARLEEVLLDPVAGSPQTQALLEMCLPETRDQGLWEQYGEAVRTLYVLSHCRPIAEPFPYTALIKLSDDAAIDPNYRYGYVLVYEYCPTCRNSPCHCGGLAGREP
jgi:hypothetical protein